MTAFGGRDRGVFAAGVLVATGGLVSALSAVLQALGARGLDIQAQAHLALAIGFGGAVAGVLAATALESRLATSAIEVKTYVPRIATILGTGGALSIPICVLHEWLWFVALPALMTALQFGRLHATVTLAWRRELWAGVSIGIAFVGALAVPQGSPVLAFSVVAIGAAVAVVSRASNLKPDKSDRPERAKVVWIGAETAVLAGMPFALNLAVLGFLGAEEAIAFRLVLTVLGILQPLLGFMRTRLLHRHSAKLIAGMTVLSAIALVVVVVASVSGLMERIFVGSWAPVTAGVILLAAVWKLCAVPAAVPFASLRRKGRVRVVFMVRVQVAVAGVLLAGLATAMSSSLAWTFAALLFVEVVGLTLLVVADRRLIQSGADTAAPQQV